MKATLIKTTLLFFAFTFYNCQKNIEEDWNPQLLGITQKGANTFGCKINRQIMIPRDARKAHPGGGGIPTGVNYARLRKPKNTANCDWVKAVDRITGRGGVAFKLPEIQNLGVGEYEVKTMIGGYVATNPNVVYMGASYNGYYGSIEGTGKIIITRYDDEVISGTFYCKLKNDHNPNDTIEITEGRFDFNKKTINTHKFR